MFVARMLVPEAMHIMQEAGLEIDMWEHEKEPTKEQIIERVSLGIHGIYSFGPLKIDSDIIDAAGSSLETVSAMSVGVDAIDLKHMKQKDLLLGHTPGVLTDAVADITVSLVLAATRRIIEMSDEARNGEWSDWSPFKSLGLGLRGTTVGIVGLGRIGIATAKRLLPFGVTRFVYSSRSGPKSLANVINAELLSFEDLLSQSDFVLACCSLNDSTRELFNEKAFNLMKNSAVFVNIGRGGLVNQNSLVSALKDGDIRAAGLDVTSPEPLPNDHDLFKLKNCVILPHIGSAEVQTRSDMATMAARNMVAALSGAKMPAQYPL